MEGIVKVHQTAMEDHGWPWKDPSLLDSSRAHKGIGLLIDEIVAVGATESVPFVDHEPQPTQCHQR